MSDARQDHRNKISTSKAELAVSWFQGALETSLPLIVNQHRIQTLEPTAATHMTLLANS
jgi:hypothetical protein